MFPMNRNRGRAKRVGVDKTSKTLDPIMVQPTVPQKKPVKITDNPPRMNTMGTPALRKPRKQITMINKGDRPIISEAFWEFNWKVVW